MNQILSWILFIIFLILPIDLAWPLLLIILVPALVWNIIQRIRIKNLEAKFQKGEASPEEQHRLREYQKKVEAVKEKIKERRSREYIQKQTSTYLIVFGILFILFLFAVLFLGLGSDGGLGYLPLLCPVIGIIMLIAGLLMRRNYASKEDNSMESRDN